MALFRSLFSKPYYPYNAGTLIHVNASEHVTTGFNQWDEVWETGGINTNGSNTSTAGYYRSKNYVPVVSNTTYYFKFPVNMNVFWYDADKALIKRETTIKDESLVSPVGSVYLRFRNDTANAWTPYNNDICINLSWDGERDGEYEPYIEHTYPLDSSLTLRGVPKLVDSKLAYDGDIYEPDGTVTRKYGIVDLGTLSWSKIESSGRFYTSVISPRPKDRVTATSYDNAILSAKYVNSNEQYANTIPDKCFIIASSGRVYLNDETQTATTASNFKTSMNGVYMVYEIETSTTESADPYTNPFIVDDWGTEAFTVTEQSSVAMPVGHNTRYTSNLKAKLEMAPDSPSMGNGKYVVQHQNGLNEYVLLENEIPSVPTGTDATYVLKATVSGSTTTLSWVQE